MSHSPQLLCRGQQDSKCQARLLPGAGQTGLHCPLPLSYPTSVPGPPASQTQGFPRLPPIQLRTFPPTVTCLGLLLELDLVLGSTSSQETLGLTKEGGLWTRNPCCQGTNQEAGLWALWQAWMLCDPTELAVAKLLLLTTTGLFPGTPSPSPTHLPRSLSPP